MCRTVRRRPQRRVTSPFPPPGRRRADPQSASHSRRHRSRCDWSSVRPPTSSECLVGISTPGSGQTSLVAVPRGAAWPHAWPCSSVYALCRLAEDRASWSPPRLRGEYTVPRARATSLHTDVQPSNILCPLPAATGGVWLFVAPGSHPVSCLDMEFASIAASWSSKPSKKRCVAATFLRLAPASRRHRSIRSSSNGPISGSARALGCRK